MISTGFSNFSGLRTADEAGSPIVKDDLRRAAACRLAAWLRLAATVFVFCASGVFVSAAPAPVTSPYPVTALNGADALQEVTRFVAQVSHPKVPPGGQRADWIKERLAALGVSAGFDTFQDPCPGGQQSFTNVVVKFPGRQPGVVILAAHHDLKVGIPDFVGANDSGSGVGLLLAMAPLIKAGTVDGPSVWLAFLDGEECMVDYGPNDGLHGSRHMAAGLVAAGLVRRVKAFVLLDMIGDRDLLVTIPRNSTSRLISEVFRAAEDCGVRTRFSLSNQGILDDHQPFLDAGISAVDLIDFDYGSVPGLNDFWHTPADTLGKLSADSLQTVGRVVLQVLNRMQAK